MPTLVACGKRVDKKGVEVKSNFKKIQEVIVL